MDINWSKWIKVGIALAIIFYVIGDPKGAAHDLGLIVGWFKEAGTALVTFVRSVFANEAQ